MGKVKEELDTKKSQESTHQGAQGTIGLTREVQVTSTVKAEVMVVVDPVLH